MTPAGGLGRSQGGTSTPQHLKEASGVSRLLGETEEVVLAFLSLRFPSQLTRYHLRLFRLKLDRLVILQNVRTPLRTAPNGADHLSRAAWPRQSFLSNSSTAQLGLRSGSS
jgi:hypothetical protein